MVVEWPAPLTVVGPTMDALAPGPQPKAAIATRRAQFEARGLRDQLRRQRKFHSRQYRMGTAFIGCVAKIALPPGLLRARAKPSLRDASLPPITEPRGDESHQR
jgi:hypothetical protein